MTQTSTPITPPPQPVQVGATSLSPGIGDLYMYPASTPHAVTPVTAGRRRTLVIALRAPLPPDAPLSAAYAAAAAATRAAAAAGVVAGAARIPRGEEEEAVPSRVAYWAAAEKTFRELCEGPLAAEPKVGVGVEVWMCANGCGWCGSRKGEAAEGGCARGYRLRN